MFSLHHAAIVLVLAGLFACEGAGKEDLVMICTGRTPTVASGVYGCVTRSDDVGDPDTAALPNFHVDVFAMMPPPTPGDGLVPLTESTTDEVGFFEVALAPGTYWLCTTFRRCIMIEIPASPPVRRNYDYGFGPGW